MADKKSKIPEKQYFDVRIESLVPCTLSYRVYAENEQEALKMINKQHPANIKHNIARRRDLKAVVYAAGSTMIKLMKSFGA